MRRASFVLACLGLVAAVGFGIAYAVRPYSDIQKAWLGILSALSFAGAVVCGLAGVLATLLRKDPAPRRRAN